MVSYLYRNRLKYKPFTADWFWAWTRRAWELPRLMGHCLQARSWRCSGAVIGGTTVIGKVDILGSPKNLLIGEYCSIGAAYFQVHRTIAIGDFVVINDGVKLLTGSHDIHSATYAHKREPIVVEDYAWIATNAIILQGVTIGRGAVVAAGAVVMGNVAPFTVVGGNPARKLGVRRIDEFEYVPMSFFASVKAWVGLNPENAVAEVRTGSVTNHVCSVE